ncbi:P-loop containing nucleoside triphosphate hydrolase protein [Cryptosporidium felis]|nr:P-loop containing nucleoside triphosphate hydrolase protein [Cryptosporidium felis]
MSSIVNRNKKVIRFSGVSDPTKTFYLESWDNEDRERTARQLNNRASVIGGMLGAGPNSSEGLGEVLGGFSPLQEQVLDLDNDLGEFALGSVNEDSFSVNGNSFGSSVNRPALTIKYAPRTCLDLVNDEASVRNILRWIKSWDGFVFGIDKTLTRVEQRYRRHENSIAPEAPVLLIGGPPGSGKTALIKVLARQCGYNVNEIQVSEERTTENFENSVKMAISFGTIRNSERPSLIVIDELDSISNNNSIRKSDCLDFLVRLIETHSKNQETVSRPIVCICNDIHEKSLRSLRLKAVSIVVPYPPKENTLKRLRYICRSEGIRLEDEEILDELVNTHNGDIRSCLNSIYLMAQKEPQSGRNGEAPRIQIGWDDFEGCCYTKDLELDISEFIKTCLGLEKKLGQDEAFSHVLEVGEDCMASFGLNLTGLLTENIYRCNLIHDFYYDYLKYVMDSVVEQNVLSSKTNSALPFLYSVVLVSCKIMGLQNDTFRHLGSSTLVFSQAVSNSIKSVFRDISSSTIEAFRVDTLANSFKVYTLPSIYTHFNYGGYQKYLNIWKSTRIFPKFKCLITSESGSLDPDELEALLVLKSIVSKMVCFGLRFEDLTSYLLQHGKFSQIDHYLKPDLESLYSFQCLTNSVGSGYIVNPSICYPKETERIKDIGFYTLVNQLIDFFKEEILKEISSRNNSERKKSTKKGEEKGTELDGASQEEVSGNVSVFIPSFEELVAVAKDKPTLEKTNSYCIYQYNDGCTDAVKMEVLVSDFFI